MLAVILLLDDAADPATLRGAYRQPQQSDPKTGPAVSILGAAMIEDCFF